MQESERVVFISDSNEGCLNAVASLLGSTGFTVRAFSNSQACLEAISSKEAQCHLVITGLRLNPYMGLELINKIKALRPSLPIIVLASSSTATIAVKAYKMGIHDFIEKPVRAEELILSVQNAMAACPDQPLPVKSLLTKTEYQVLLHILNGESTKEIATKRHRSVRTIEDQRSAIMKKLGVDNVVDLVKRATNVAIPY